MTVIAWDGKTLAADKLGSDGTSRRTTTKIRRASNGALLATCGDASRGREMIAWYEAGALVAEFPATNRETNTASWLLAIEAGPVVKMYQLTAHPIVFDDTCFAMGSGRDYAAAAMHLGCDARRAVEVAINLCPECGNGIDTLTLEQA